MIDDTDLDAAAPAPPLSARTAGLRVELADCPPITPRHRRRRRLAVRRITWHGLAIYFLPHLTLAGVITLAVVLLRGAFA